MYTTSFEELCSRFFSGPSTDLSALLPEGIQQEVGHFNVFNLAEIMQEARDKPAVSCASRAFYKISFLTGSSVAGYPDRTVEISRPTLIFTTPKSPLYWSPVGRQTGKFCVFTAEFFHPAGSSVMLDELPFLNHLNIPFTHFQMQTLHGYKAFFRIWKLKSPSIMPINMTCSALIRSN